MKRAIHMIYPPQCVSCDALVTTDFGLCGDCWGQVPFIFGLGCDLCGQPLPGEDPGYPVHCDSCLQTPRPWARGRSALIYKDQGRSLVLALKHGDRMELARTIGPWLVRAATPLLAGTLSDAIVAPIPLHWLRLLHRRYNQAALLSGELARLTNLRHVPDLLYRKRNTQSQEGRPRDDRFQNLNDAIGLTRRGKALVKGKHIVLVDDVMTSGATFAAAATACLSGGAKRVSILALSRAVKDA